MIAQIDQDFFHLVDSLTEEQLVKVEVEAAIIAEAWEIVCITNVFETHSPEATKFS